MAIGALATSNRLETLPKRDALSRSKLHSVGDLVAPVAKSHERNLKIDGELGALLPGSALRRGTVTTVVGINAAALTNALLAAATRHGEWAAIVEPVERRGEFGGLAALEAGVILDRCAVVRNVARERWPVVIGALLDGMSMVVASAPEHLKLADARRLVARTRERQALLVVTDHGWPAEATLRIQTSDATWHGLGEGEGLLERCDIEILIEGKAAPRRARVELAARAS